MAQNHIGTGTLTNLTRRELEQLRKADFTAGGKVLTTGDASNAGSLLTELYGTGPWVALDEVASQTPPGQPGVGLCQATLLDTVVGVRGLNATISDPSTENATLGEVTLTGGLTFTADMVGCNISILAAEPANTGFFRITARLSATSIRYYNPNATASSGVTWSVEQPNTLTCDSVRWHGAQLVFSAVGTGYASNLVDSRWCDDTADFEAAGIRQGDIVLIKPSNIGDGEEQNPHAAAVVLTVTQQVLTVYPALADDYGYNGDDYYRTDYIIIRPSPVQLFAVPGSGPVGQEQTYFFVKSNSTLHLKNPTPDEINADRLTDIVPPDFAADSLVDRADVVFDGPNHGLVSQLGYRPIFYPDDGTGHPDLANPIDARNPLIDATIPADDQRMTIDYKAGVLRLSTRPTSTTDPVSGQTGKFKPASGGTCPKTNRLNLWAVFWTLDSAHLKGSSRFIHHSRNDDTTRRQAATIKYDAVTETWRIGATPTAGFVVQALPPAEVGNESIDFGTFDSASTTYGQFRGFRYRGGTDKIKFIRRGAYLTSDYLPELDLADKTALTVGDGTAAPQLAPGGDFNPALSTFTGGQRFGFRVADTAIRDALLSAMKEGYGTVHLRRGRHVVTKTIHCPPGVTLEGEGLGTIISSIGLNGAEAPTVFKFGPNTSWGVYDPTLDDDGKVSPTTFTWSNTARLEGVDICWNPTRRVWGVVQAVVSSSAGSNKIFFNEVRPDGITTYTGSGTIVGSSTTQLFNTSSTNSENHTPGHYPRIVHDALSDSYYVIWVEGEQLSVGASYTPIVKVLRVSNSSTGMTYAGPYPIRQAAGMCSTHPSIAVQNWTGDDPKVAVTYWAYTPGLTSTNLVVARFTKGLTYIDQQVYTLPANSVVSSTDIDDDGQGNFLFAASVRKHPLILRSTGTVAFFEGDTHHGLLTDSGITDWTTVVSPGSRFLQFTSVGTHGSHVVLGCNAGYLNQLILQGDASSESGGLIQPGNNISYALAPVSYLVAGTLKSGGAYSSLSKNITLDSSQATDSYVFGEREADFVRVCRGSNGWCLVYQTFDTNINMTRSNIPNFANSFSDTPYLDKPPLTTTYPTLGETIPYREHLSTCYVILSDDAQVIYPSVPQAIYDQEDLSPEKITNINLARRSLGSRHLRVPYDNAILAKERFDFEVSARNYYLPWSATDKPSLIPDITWTGEDWVIVSPTINRIHSKTGLFYTDNTKNYLIDQSFYFGQEASTPLGQYLRGTVSSSDQIYFPSLSLSVNVLDPQDSVSEHVLRLANGNLGLVSGTKYEWYLKSTSPMGRIKNPGFRVAADGRVISSSSFFTFADEPVDESVTIPRYQELLSRHLWGNTTTVSGYGCGGSYGASFNAWLFYPTPRVYGDLSFKGVAVGEPKPSSERMANEPPMLALAWGDNLYAFADRFADLTSNSTKVYRQTFGKFKSTIKDLTIEGPRNQTLGVLTRQHVFTRFGHPACSTGDFATDGYRSCFVAPCLQYLGNRSEPYDADPSVDVAFRANGGLKYSYKMHLSATYTDAIGRDAIYTHGGPFITSSREPLTQGLASGSPKGITGTLNSVTNGIVTLTGGSNFDPGHVGGYVTISNANYPPNNGTFLITQWNDSTSIQYRNPNGAAQAAFNPGQIHWAVTPPLDSLNVGAPKVIWDGRNFVAFAVSAAPKPPITTLTCTSVHDRNQIDFPSSPVDLASQGLQIGCILHFEDLPNVSTRYYKVTSISGNSVTVLPYILPLGDTLYNISMAVYYDSMLANVTAVVFPGSEDDGAPSADLVGRILTPSEASESSLDSDADYHKIVASFDVSSGMGLYNRYATDGQVSDNLTSNLYRDVTIIDVACSPHNYAVVWAIGIQNSQGQQKPGGSVLGVTLIDKGLGGVTTQDTKTVFENGASIPEHGRSYVLAVSDSKGVYQSPKILWDGMNYVVVYIECGSTFGEDQNIRAIAFPPSGFSAGLTGLLSAAPNSGYPGNISDPLGIIDPLGIHLVNQPLQRIRPGDVLVISRTSAETVSAGLPDCLYPAGWYVIRDFDPQLGILSVGSDLRKGWSSDTANSSMVVYGTILSGGYSDTSTTPYTGATSGLNRTPVSLQSSGLDTLAKAAVRIHGFVYDETKELYTILYESGLIPKLYVTNFSRNQGELRSHTQVSTNSVAMATLAWNGGEYLVVWTEVAGTTATYSILSSSLQVMKTATLVSRTDLMGNGPNQKPGSLYDAYDSSAEVLDQASLRGVRAAWNSKLSRWVISTSVLTFPTGDSNSAMVGVLGAAYYNTTNRVAGAVADCFTGHTLHTGTIPGAPMNWTARQAGARLILCTTDPGISASNGAIFNIISRGSNTLEVCTDSSEVHTVENNDEGIDFTYLRPYFLPREDVFVFTVGASNPTIKLEDADGVTLDNVSLTGGSIPIEDRRIHTARPIWQVGGMTLGCVTGLFAGGIYHSSGEDTLHGIDTAGLGVANGDIVYYGDVGVDPDNPVAYYTVVGYTADSITLYNRNAIPPQNASFNGVHYGTGMVLYNHRQRYPWRPRVTYRFLTPKDKTEGLHAINVQGLQKRGY